MAIFAPHGLQYKDEIPAKLRVENYLINGYFQLSGSLFIIQRINLLLFVVVGSVNTMYLNIKINGLMAAKKHQIAAEVNK